MDKAGLIRIGRYRTRSGLEIYCRGRSTDINEAVVILSGLEYPEEFLHLENGSVVIDIGANIGSFALYVHELNRSIAYRGIAFEPFPESFALLENNLRSNNVSTFVPIQAAVTDIDGQVRLVVGRDLDRVRVEGPAANDDHKAACSYRLSTFCAANNIDVVDLLKMDVEGGEYDIVQTDYEFISRSVARALIEYHNLGRNQTFDRLVERMHLDFEISVVHELEYSGVLHALNRNLAANRMQSRL